MKPATLQQVLCVAAVLLAAALATHARAGNESTLRKREVDATLRPLLDGDWLSGIVVGVVTAQGREVAGCGHIAGKDSPAPDANTVFELGSVTKTFTALLLQQMADAGEVSLDDPVQKYLPDTVKIPTRRGKQITLLHLATHSSGLPRMPTNLTPKDPANPYADYTPQQMYAFLSACVLPRDIGERVEYSNLGMGLLGHALARKAGTSYEDLVVSRICKPLGMDSTRMTLDDSMRKRLAPGHDGDGNSVENWDIPTFAGAGALRTTADDMLNYVAAQLGLTQTPLAAAMKATQAPRQPITPGMDIAMAWHIVKSDHIVWHNGETGGYHTFIAFAPDQKVGLVLLSNRPCRYLDAVGFRLLRLHAGLKTGAPLQIPTAVKVDTAALDACAGTYKLSLLVRAHVKRAGDHLTLQLTGQSPVNLYPASDVRFFARVVDAEVTFERDAEGKVKQFVLHQNGQDVPAPRLTESGD